MAAQRDWFADYQQRFAAVQQQRLAVEEEEASAPLLDPADLALAKRRLAA